MQADGPDFVPAAAFSRNNYRQETYQRPKHLRAGQLRAGQRADAFLDLTLFLLRIGPLVRRVVMTQVRRNDR